MLLTPPRLQPRAMRRAQGGWFINPYRFKNDPYIQYVVHLAHFDDSAGKGGASSWLNSVPRGNELARSNTVRDSTAYKFGGFSSRLGNTDGMASASAHADYQFGTNPFTIEFWFRPDARTLTVCFDMRNSINNTACAALSTNTSGDLFYYVLGATRITGSGAITAGAWQAICICRVAGNTRMFVNGAQVGSAWSDSTNYNATAPIRMGGYVSNQRNVNHEELRITNGIGRYASNYTVDTGPFPNS